MFEQSRDELEADEMTLSVAEGWIVSLIDIAQDDSMHLELCGYHFTSTIDRLERLSHAIWRRKTQIQEELEAIRNEPLDNFIRRRIR